MLFNKGLALGGAMLVAAIPGQSATLHAQSANGKVVTTQTVSGGVRVVTRTLPAAAANSARRAPVATANQPTRVSPVETVVNAVSTAINTVTAAAGTLVDQTIALVSAPAPTTTVQTGTSTTTTSTTTQLSTQRSLLPAPTMSSMPTPVENNLVPDPDTVAAPVVAKVFTVSNATEQRSALTEAQGLAGAEIRLNPGHSGDLVWNFKNYPLGRVYVVAATSTKPVFRSIEANSSSNMSFHGLKVTGSGVPRMVKLNGSRNMSFTGSEISGTTENNDPWDDSSTGMQIRFSTNVVVQDNRFSDLRVAIYAQRSSKVDIRYNRVMYVREGMNIVAVDSVQLRANHFSHFYPRYDLGEHPDAIQLWTNGEVVGSTRVRLTENVIVMGEKRAIQGVLSGCEAAGVRHSDWEVTRNVYYGSSVHGLSFHCVDRLKVWNNVIVASPHADVNNSIRTASTSGGYLPRLRIRASTGVTTWNNILMAGPSLDATTVATSTDNWDLVDAMGWGGIPWTDVFADGRPTSLAPPLSAFITRDPSLVRTRNGGVLAPYVHGVRSLTKNQQLADVATLLAD